MTSSRSPTTPDPEHSDPEHSRRLLDLWPDRPLVSALCSAALAALAAFAIGLAVYGFLLPVTG